MSGAPSPTEARVALGAAAATSSGTLTLLTPRQRVAKLFEAFGLGHYEPEHLAELHVRDRFGGRPPRPDQRAAARRFEDLMHLAYGIEIWGLDIPKDSFHGAVFDALTIEQIEEALLLQATMRRLVREAKGRVRAIAERPSKWLGPIVAAPDWTAADRTDSRDRERRPGCERTRGSRRAATRAGPKSEPHEADPDDVGRLAGGGR